MDGRHRYIATVANDAFELGNPNTVEAVMSEHVEQFDSVHKFECICTQHSHRNTLRRRRNAVRHRALRPRVEPPDAILA